MWYILQQVDFKADNIGGEAVDPNDYGNLPSIRIPEKPQRLRKLRNRRFRYLEQDS